jgi:hypothetical protein
VSVVCVSFRGGRGSGILEAHQATGFVMRLLFFAVAVLLPLIVLGQEPTPPNPLKSEDVNVLREYVTRPLPKSVWAERHRGQIDKARALLKYAKLNPVDAREIALSELASSDPDIACNGLLFLDDEELPQLTEAFRENLKAETYWWHLRCVERYGSIELLPDVVGLYESAKGRWACEIAAACLGFIVKHDRASGLKLVEEAVNLRGETGCYKDVMRDVLEKYPGDDVLELSLKYIGDSDESVSTNAAYLTLKQSGGKERLLEILRGGGGKITDRTREYIEALVKAARTLNTSPPAPNNSLPPPPRHEVIYGRCAGARVMPAVRRFLVSAHHTD